MLLRDGSLWRSSALEAQGIAPATLTRALQAGIVVRVSRGTYRIADAAQLPELSLAAAVKRTPRAVVCLLSAAHNHKLIDEAPAALWLAVPAGGSPRRIEHVQTHIISWSHKGAFDVGISRTTILGVNIATTNPARTVVDLLRYQRHLEGGEKPALSAARSFFDMGGKADDLTKVAEALACSPSVRAKIDVIVGMAPVASRSPDAQQRRGGKPAATGTGRRGRE